MKKFTYLISILIVFCACEQSEQDIKPGFDKKILDNYFIKSITFDDQGTAWIGTFKQGLIKHNSNKTTVFDSKNSPLADSAVIHDIAIDSKGNIWVGSNGLFKYDGNTFTHYHSGNSDIPEDFVSSIAIDSKDNVWFTSCRFREGGIVKYDGTDWRVFTPDNSELPVNFVHSITIDRNDAVWLALGEIVDNAYLVKITGDNWNIYTSDDLGFALYYLSTIKVNCKNELIGTIDYSLSSTFVHEGPQAFKFDGTSSEQLKYDDFVNFRFLTIDDHDNIWFGGSQAYGVYNGQNWLVDDSSFIKESIFAIEQSNNNKIWIGTSKGIYIKNGL